MSKSTIFGTTKGYDIQVGNVYESDKAMTLYPRSSGKDEHAIKDAMGFKVTALNKAGRRFTCDFYNTNRETITTRKVYREYVESLIDQLGLQVSNPSPVEATVLVEA